MDTSSVKDAIPARDAQIELFDSLISCGRLLNSVIVHGISSGKTLTVKTYFQHFEKIESSANIIYTDCSMAISLRNLFSRVLKQVGLANELDVTEAPLCETVNKFNSYLEKISMRTGKYNYIVFENVELLLEYVKLAQFVSGLAEFLEESEYARKWFLFVFMINKYNLQFSKSLSELNTRSIPTLFFQNYVQEEVVEILTQSQLAGRLNKSGCRDSFWRSFVKLVVDSFYVYTGSDLNQLVEIIVQLQPLTMKYKETELLKMYRENSKLFSSERLILSQFEDFGDSADELIDLPLYSNYILCSAYLASYVAAKNDFVIFSKQKNITARKHSRRKAKKTKLNPQLFSPSSFELERLVSILQTIFQADNQDSSLNLNVDFYTQFSNLVSLNLIFKTLGSSYNPGLDLLNSNLKFKINFGYDFIEKIAASLNFPLAEYLVE